MTKEHIDTLWECVRGCRVLKDEADEILATLEQLLDDLTLKKKNIEEVRPIFSTLL